jgi:hypothetical protein
MATLKTTITEQVQLQGQQQGGTVTNNIIGVTNVVKRIVTATTTEVGLLGFAANLTALGSTGYLAGVFAEDKVKYIRITNLDGTNHIVLTFKDEDDTEFAIKLDKGKSFIYNGDVSGGLVDTMHAGSGLTVSLNDLVDITVDADTASCKVEVFVASTD